MMRKYFTITLLIIVYSLTTKGQDITSFPYFTGFEGVESNLSQEYPSGWVSEDLNTVQFGNQGWQIIKNTSMSQNAHSDSTAVHMFSHMTEQNNDWLFTPSVQMQTGRTYRLHFWYKCNQIAGSSEKLKIYAGSENNAISMQSGSVIWDNESITNTEYQQAIAEFTPPQDGIYYFAFYYYSDPFQFILLVDDVTIEDMGLNGVEPIANETGCWVSNPVLNNLIVHTSKNTQHFIVQVFDAKGALKIDKTVNGNGLELIPRNNLPSGLYFVRIIGLDDQLFYSGKLILQ